MGFRRSIVRLSIAIFVGSALYEAHSRLPQKSEVTSQAVMVWPREGGAKAIPRLVEWFQHNGGFLSPNIQLTPGGRVFIRGIFPRNQPVVQVTPKLVLTGKKAKTRILEALGTCKGLLEWLKRYSGDDGSSRQSWMAVFLLLESTPGEFFQPYVGSLPGRSVRFLPHQFNDTELELLRGSNAALKDLGRRRRVSISDMYQHLCWVTRDSAPWFCQTHSVADFMWTYSAVMSRAWTVGTSQERCVNMCPLLISPP
jgi:hypothetical protein